MKRLALALVAVLLVTAPAFAATPCSPRTIAVLAPTQYVETPCIVLPNMPPFGLLSPCINCPGVQPIHRGNGLVCLQAEQRTFYMVLPPPSKNGRCGPVAQTPPAKSAPLPAPVAPAPPAAPPHLGLPAPAPAPQHIAPPTAVVAPAHFSAPPAFHAPPAPPPAHSSGSGKP